MRDRLKLQAILEEKLGSSNVYFQPPASVRMKYPAIVYSRSDIDNRFADNSPYSQEKAYTVTVIDKDPDSKIVDRIASLPKCMYDRNYRVENLNHDVFTLFY